MISFVVVSHSRALADAAVAIAAELAAGEDSPVVEVAAGLADGTLGTDATAIAAALVRADQASGGQGVLVLMDLGSAVLSAEMALELVGPDVAARVRLSAAALVEGLVAGVVSAGSGRDLDAVAREAECGLAPKVAHLLPEGAEEQTEDGPDPRPEPTRAVAEGRQRGAARLEQTVELVVLGPHGLHARPAARLVSCAAGFAPQTSVRLTNLTSGRGPVDALSLSRVATLDARQNHTLLVEAGGPRAQEALDALSALAAEGFGDLPGIAAPSVADAALDPAGEKPAAEAFAGSGLDAAVGPVLRLDARLDAHGIPAQDRATERRRWAAAMDAAERRLGELAEEAREQLGDGAAEVFAAHALLLHDPELTATVERRIDAGEAAARAWADTVEAASAWFEQLADPYQRVRAYDVRAAGERVLRLLLGMEEPQAPGAGVLVVDELDPGLAISLDVEAVRGVATWRGGETGHGVLIAASRGVPVLTRAEALADVAAGTVVAFDVRSRRLEVDPSPELLRVFEDLLDRRSRERERAMETSREPVRTTDGTPLRVRANVSSVAMAHQAAGMGAQGAGLVRTEVVFGHCLQAPSVEQQVEVYSEIVAAFDPHPVAIRTWDVGGDKPLPFIPALVEANPFLGVRGLRVFAREPALLLDQLEAVCRVAADHDVQVLFPMVTTRADVDLAQNLLRQAARRAGLDGPPPRLHVGIMVEVPAAALNVAALAVGLDVISIGSNDLSQYVLAADRGNGDVAAWSDPLDPSVLRLVRATCEAVADRIPVSLCGAMAADPGLAGLLVGLGVRQLSAVPTAVPLVKERLRAGSMAQFRELADRALACPDAAAVRALLAEDLSARPVGGTAR